MDQRGSYDKRSSSSPDLVLALAMAQWSWTPRKSSEKTNTVLPIKAK